MLLDWEIEDFEKIEVESSKNAETPITQADFERNLKIKK